MKPLTSFHTRALWRISLVLLFTKNHLALADVSASESDVSTENLSCLNDAKVEAATTSTTANDVGVDEAMTCSASNTTTSTSASSTPVSSEENEESTSSQQLECGLWLAPSSLPNAGLGMYAGRDFAKHEHLQDSGDVIIPIVDIRTHCNDFEFSFLWDEYTWESSDYDPWYQVDREGLVSVEYASPGFGSAANSFLPLQNVEEENPVWDNAGLHRSRDPGAGAFSQYGNRTSVATRDISAGEELFVSYGESWFTGREFLGAIPLTDDLNRATELAQSFSNLYRNLSHQHHHFRTILKDLWSQFVQNDSLYKDSRVLGAFNHSDPDELEHLQSGKDMVEIRTNQSMRTLDWLRQHGACVDHIGARPSTLPQAGHGAFARRHLPNGTVVTSLPMIHIPDRSIFEMYPIEILGASPLVHREMDRKGYQLLLNYCYGHEASSLLLCPYGPHGSYINHNQTLANVKIVWGDPERGNHQPKYLDLPIEALMEGSKSAKLAMDVIAIRDISEGEELFLDYGNSWEEAWQSHVENWRPTEGSESYAYAVALNRDQSTPLPTKSELEDHNPHPNVELMCSAVFLDYEDWKLYYPDRLNEYLENETLFGAESSYKCDIQSRRVDELGNHVYTALAWTWDAENDPYATQLEEYVTVVDVPRQAFAYFERPYSSDTFLPNTFRHHIGIPDEMFPEAWRNLETPPAEVGE